MGIAHASRGALVCVTLKRCLFSFCISVGVIAYLCMAKSISFHVFIEDIKNLVKTGTFVFNDPSWQTVSPAAKGFIASLLTWDQEKRPSATIALTNVWVGRKDHTAPAKAAPLRNPIVNQQMHQAAVVIMRCLISMKDERDKIERVLNPKGFTPDKALTKTNVKEVYVSSFGKELAYHSLAGSH